MVDEETAEYRATVLRRLDALHDMINANGKDFRRMSEQIESLQAAQKKQTEAVDAISDVLTEIGKLYHSIRDRIMGAQGNHEALHAIAKELDQHAEKLDQASAELSGATVQHAKAADMAVEAARRQSQDSGSVGDVDQALQNDPGDEDTAKPAASGQDTASGAARTSG